MKKRKVQKQKRIRQLRKKLWVIFSKYIRLRDGNVCITCGKRSYPAHAGHFIDKSISNPELYFHPCNVNCQCVSCNLYKSGNKAVYAKKLIDKYGLIVFNSLHELRGKCIKWTIEDYERQICYYTKELNNGL